FGLRLREEGARGRVPGAGHHVTGRVERALGAGDGWGAIGAGGERRLRALLAGASARAADRLDAGVALVAGGPRREGQAVEAVAPVEAATGFDVLHGAAGVRLFAAHELDGLAVLHAHGAGPAGAARDADSEEEGRQRTGRGPNGAVTALHGLRAITMRQVGRVF